MEVTPLLSPLSIGTGNYYDNLRRFPTPVKLAPTVVEPVVEFEVCTPPTVEPGFAVDDLLDFSQEDDEPREEPESLTVASTPSFSTPASGSVGHTSVETTPPLSHDIIQAQSSDGLFLPPEELTEQLEWLSAFNEDNSYGGDRNLASLVSSGSLKSSMEEEEAYQSQDVFQTPSPVSVLESTGAYYGATTSSNVGNIVPSRARSKRARGTTRLWSLDSIIPTLVDNRLGGAQETPVFLGGSSNLSSQPLPKKQKKISLSSKCAAVEAPPRRCTHCLVQKTPQWRAGPLGPKTLCNACGVRYKSGRLLPEYRPAGSPTFVSEVHSNSHKRILEMRRMKESEEQQQPQQPLELQSSQQMEQLESQVKLNTIETDDSAEESHSYVGDACTDSSHSNDTELSHSLGNDSCTVQHSSSIDIEESISSIN